MAVVSQSIKFFREALNEFKKVTWPGKKEIVAATVVVIILVIIVAIYVGTIDFVLSAILAVLLR